MARASEDLQNVQAQNTLWCAVAVSESHNLCNSCLRNPMSSIAVQFSTKELEEAFLNSQFSAQYRLFDCLAISLPSYISQLPPQPFTYRADLVLRAALALWVLLCSHAHYRRFHTPVLITMRLWLAVLPLVLLFAPQATPCARSTTLNAVFGNSIIYPLILQLPFAMHIPMALLGLGTSTLLAVGRSACCGELHTDTPLWISWTLPEYPAPSACAQALVTLHGSASMCVSTLLLWCVWGMCVLLCSLHYNAPRRELLNRQSFLMARGIPTLPYSIPLVMLRWVACCVFATSQLIMLAPLFLSS